MAEFSDEAFAVTQGTGPTAEGHFEQFPPGRILAGKYQVISVLGQGGMGTVYHVEQIFLQKELALKVLDRRGAINDVQVRRFQMEARAAFSLTHPNLVKVHDFGVFEDGQPYLVMDYVPGKTLASVLKNQGALSIEQIGQIFPQACFGIAYAHQQSIIHRDIKPSNIMLVDGIAPGAEGSVKIVDFGIAKVAGEEGGEIQTLTKTGEIFGSPLYMSPEQCSGEKIDTRTDVYSLGCVLFEALTGTPPLVGNNALRTMMLHQTEAIPTLKEASMGKDFPNGFEQIVRQMLQKSPADRADNLGIVAHAIGEASKGCYENAEAATQLARTAPQKTETKLENRSFLAGLAVAGAAVILSGIVALLLNNPDKIHASDPIKTNKTSSGTVDISSAVNEFDPDAQSNPINGFENGDVTPQALQGQIDILKKSGPIKSQLLQHNGKLTKCFVFPDCGMGRISNRWQSQQTFEKIQVGKIEAVGKQWIPAGVPLTLELNSHYAKPVFAHPSILEKVDPKEFNEILISTRMPATLQNQLSEELLSFSFLKMLKICSSWTNLYSVVILDLPVSKESLDILTQFPHLQSLYISSPETPVNLVGQPVLKKLSSLGLDQIDTNKLLPTLASLPKLESLDLVDTNASPAALLSLRNCARLRLIRFCQMSGATDEQLKALTQLKQLRTLYIKDTAISLSQLKILTGSSKNTRLLISSKSQAAINALDPADARVELVAEQSH